ncbi:MAG: hypothetical protein KatS3mg076_0662 [Candidatus Binatia bacterium]|nr:MAG: hypothetical protein KatS3mg076_0662 [Candidatus Binatia bacterium]
MRGTTRTDEGFTVPRRISRFALEQRSRLLEGETEGIRRLMWAMLKDSLRCYQSYFDSTDVREQRLFWDAQRWIQAENPRWLFSFDNVCAVLGIDGDRLRAELARWARLRRRARERARERAK